MGKSKVVPMAPNKRSAPYTLVNSYEYDGVVPTTDNTNELQHSSSEPVS